MNFFAFFCLFSLSLVHSLIISRTAKKKTLIFGYLFHKVVNEFGRPISHENFYQIAVKTRAISLFYYYWLQSY